MLAPPPRSVCSNNVVNIGERAHDDAAHVIPVIRARLARLAGAAALVVLGACASGPERAVLVPVVSADAANTQVLSRAVTGKLSDGQAFRLEDASQWRRVGALVQGDVYRPLGAPVALGKARARRPIWWRLPDG